MKLPIIIATCLLCIPSCYASGQSNYVEVGLGVSQLFSFNKDTNDALSDYSVSPSLKLLTGSRLNRARTIWFELGYSHNGEMKYRDTKLNSQSIFTGLKLSTPPSSNASIFARFGGGKTLTTLKIDGEKNQKNDSIHYYMGTGVNIRLDSKKSLLAEIQHIADEGSNEAINSIFLSFNQSF